MNRRYVVVWPWSWQDPSFIVAQPSGRFYSSVGAVLLGFRVTG